jgi:predicted acetyltransferase
MPGLRLRPLEPADEAAARRAHAELEPEGFRFLFGHEEGEPFPDYVERLRRWSRGLDLPANLVPAALLAAVVGEDVVGRVSVRLSSGGEVLTRVGHIGYAVRPACRRRGHASDMLRQTVVLARSHGIEQVLLTCDHDNLASAAVIARGGGVEDAAFADRRGVKRRFWIRPRADELWLRPLGPDDEIVAEKAHAELADDDFPFLLDRDRAAESWDEYVGMLDRWRHGVDLPADRVPAAFLLAQVGADVVGRVSVRFALNAFLHAKGGHIGYAVRPAFRGRGYASEMLRQALVVARAEGVDRALVTCDPDNAASARAIARNGGIEEPGSDGVRRFRIS